MRRLAYAVALALVPVLVVTSGPAHAWDIRESPHVGFTLEAPGHFYGYQDVTCEGQIWVVWAGADQGSPTSVTHVNWSDIRCVGGPDISPGFSQPGEPGSQYRIWVTGNNCGGSYSGTMADNDANSIQHIAGTIPEYAYRSGDALCDPASVCIRLTGVEPGNNSFSEACTPITIDVPSDLQNVYEEPTTCTSATVARPTIGAAEIRSYPGPAGTTRLQWVQTVDFPVTATGTPPPAGWGIYAVGQTVTDNSNFTITDNPNMWQRNYSVPAATSGGTWVGGTAVKPVGRYELPAPPSTQTTLRVVFPVGVSKGSSEAETNPPTIGWAIVGAGIYGYPEGGSVNRTKYELYFTGNASNVFGRIGRTDPGLCSFYWGKKLFDVTGVTTDDPGGPLVAPPPPVVPEPPASCEEDPDQPECAGSGEEADCGEFSITDPSTWAGVGACMLVKLVRGLITAVYAVVTAIGKLAAQIADALLGGITVILEELFVPSSSHFKTKLNEVKASWNDTPPGVVLAEVVGIPAVFQINSTSTTCQGPEVDLNWGFGGGGNQEWYPLSTCGTGMSRLANIVYVSLQVVVWLGGLLLCFRILAGALGYNTHLRVGGGDD